MIIHFVQVNFIFLRLVFENINSEDELEIKTPPLTPKIKNGINEKSDIGLIKLISHDFSKKNICI